MKFKNSTALQPAHTVLVLTSKSVSDHSAFAACVWNSSRLDTVFLFYMFDLINVCDIIHNVQYHQSFFDSIGQFYSFEFQ